MRILDRERAWLQSLRPLERYNAVAAYWAILLWCVAAGISTFLHWRGNAYLSFDEWEDEYVNLEGKGELAILTSILIALVIVTYSYTYYETLDRVAVREASEASEASEAREARIISTGCSELPKESEGIEYQRQHFAKIDLGIDTVLGTTAARLFTLFLPLYLSVLRGIFNEGENSYNGVAMTPEALIGYLLLFVLYYERIGYYIRVFLIVVLTSLYASVVL